MDQKQNQQSLMEQWQNLSKLSKTAIIIGGTVFGVGVWVWSYLREDNSQSTGIINYLEGVDPSRKSVYKPPAKSSLLAKGPPTSFQKGYIPVLILYGTEYGFSGRLAQRMRTELENLAQEIAQDPKMDGVMLYPRALNMEDYEKLDWKSEHIVICITSTYGEGVPPTNSREFFTTALGCDFEGEEVKYESRDIDLKGTHFSVLGLGDTSYTFFARCGKTLDERFEKLGGNRFYPRTDVDLEDEEVIKPWFVGVVAQTKSLVLENADAWKVEGEDYLWNLISQDTSTKWGRNNPFFSKCVEKYDVSKYSNEGDKETIHFEFHLADSDLSYTVGDSLAVLAPTPQSEIDLLLKTLSIDPKIQLEKPIWAWPSSPTSPVPEKLSISQALQFYDIKNMQFKVLQTLKQAVEGKETQVDQKQLEHLNSLLSKGKAEASVKKYLEESDAVDIFTDFSDLTRLLKPATILSGFSDLKARYYSISSTQTIDPKVVSITVAIVRYELKNRKRKGVCSTHLADMIKKGQENIPIYVNNNPDFRIPEDSQKDILMVGPGTGLAPFRGMIQERKKTGAQGKNILFFGCRNEDDYLYRDQLETWQTEGTLQLFVAFSRKTEQKVYVQHLIAQQPTLVWEHFNNGGHFYICGDGAHMEHDVKNAVLKIFQEQGSMDEKAALEHWKELERNRRIQKDTWL